MFCFRHGIGSQAIVMVVSVTPFSLTLRGGSDGPALMK